MNSLFIRALVAFLALPGVVAFGVPVLLILLGWAVLFSSRAIAAYAGVFAPIVHLRVLYHEEPFLARTHGRAWAAYAARVPDERTGAVHRGERARID